jgi:hypothetical protein
MRLIVLKIVQKLLTSYGALWYIIHRRAGGLTTASMGYEARMKFGG